MIDFSWSDPAPAAPAGGSVENAAVAGQVFDLVADPIAGGVYFSDAWGIRRIEPWSGVANVLEAGPDRSYYAGDFAVDNFGRFLMRGMLMDDTRAPGVGVKLGVLAVSPDGTAQNLVGSICRRYDFYHEDLGFGRGCAEFDTNLEDGAADTVDLPNAQWLTVFQNELYWMESFGHLLRPRVRKLSVDRQVVTVAAELPGQGKMHIAANGQIYLFSGGRSNFRIGSDGTTSYLEGSPEVFDQCITVGEDGVVWFGAGPYVTSIRPDPSQAEWAVETETIWQISPDGDRGPSSCMALVIASDGSLVMVDGESRIWLLQQAS